MSGGDVDGIARAVFAGSQVPVGSAAAVYMQAVAVQLTGADLEHGMEVFAREDAAQGLRPA